VTATLIIIVIVAIGATAMRKRSKL